MTAIETSTTTPPVNGHPATQRSRLAEYRPTATAPQFPLDAHLGVERGAEVLAFPVHRPSEILAMDCSDEVAILSAGNEDIWVRGGLMVVLGGCGIGKSRWVYSLAVSDILQRPFCGFEMSGAGKWLIISPETSRKRAQKDLMRTIYGGGLTAAQILALDANLCVVSANVADRMPPTNLDDRSAQDAMRKLAETHRPDVVVIDPWEAFIGGGDVNDMGETRRSVELLRSVFSGSTLLIVHHSREGVEAVKSASGFGSTAFTKGSKTLTTMCRTAINLTARHSATDTATMGHGLVIQCGKVNDSRGFATRAAMFNDNDGTYDVEADFDAKGYSMDVDGRRKEPAISILELLQIVESGKTKRADIFEELGERGNTASEGTLKKKLTAAVKGKYLISPKHGIYNLGPDSAKELAKAASAKAAMVKAAEAGGSK